MTSIIASSNSHVYIPRLIPDTLTAPYITQLADKASEGWREIQVYKAPESGCFLEIHIFIDGYSLELDDKFDLHRTMLRGE